MPVLAPIIPYVAAAAAAAGAGTAIYSATKGAPKGPGMTQAATDPNANVYRDRNAQNALVQGGASTGTGSLLTSPGNVAGNTLLGQ